MSDPEFLGGLISEEHESDAVTTSNPLPQFFIAEAGQLTDVWLLAGGAGDKALLSGH